MKHGKTLRHFVKYIVPKKFALMKNNKGLLDNLLCNVSGERGQLHTLSPMVLCGPVNSLIYKITQTQLVPNSLTLSGGEFIKWVTPAPLWSLASNL